MGDNNNNNNNNDGPHLIEDDDVSETVAFKVRAEENLYASDPSDCDNMDGSNALYFRNRGGIPTYVSTTTTTASAIMASKKANKKSSSTSTTATSLGKRKRSSSGGGDGRSNSNNNNAAKSKAAGTAAAGASSSSYEKEFYEYVARKKAAANDGGRSIGARLESVLSPSFLFQRRPLTHPNHPNHPNLNINQNRTPNVASGKEFMFLLKKTQPFLKVFLHYQKKHNLKKEHIELQFGNQLLSEEDTPSSIQLQQNDTVIVRKCRNPDILFKVKAEEDLFSPKKKHHNSSSSKKRTSSSADGGGTTATTTTAGVVVEDDDNNKDQQQQKQSPPPQKPKVKQGTEIVLCLRKTQRFSSYLFNIFHRDLRREDLEFRFGLNLIKEEDTPSSIGLQTNDTIWVRKCRNPSLKKPSTNIMFEVKVEEDLYSNGNNNNNTNKSDDKSTTAIKKPDVKKGKNYFFLLRKTQRLQKVFQTFMTLNEHLDPGNCKLEFRFNGRVLTNNDTPNSVNLEQNDIIWVRNGSGGGGGNKKKGGGDDDDDDDGDDGDAKMRLRRATRAVRKAARDVAKEIRKTKRASSTTRKRPSTRTTAATSATGTTIPGPVIRLPPPVAPPQQQQQPQNARYNLRNRRHGQYSPVSSLGSSSAAAAARAAPSNNDNSNDNDGSTHRRRSTRKRRRSS